MYTDLIVIVIECGFIRTTTPVSNFPHWISIVDIVNSDETLVNKHQ